MTIPRHVYTAAMRLASPAILAHLARRSRRQAGVADDWRARLGWGAHDTRSPLWLHGASAGEVQSLAALAVALAETHPIRLSAFTATGLDRARILLPEVPADLSPLDLPGAWRRYLDRIAPQLAIVAETELWPNLLATAVRRRLPVVLVSASMSARTARRLARFPATARALMGSLTQVLAQSDADLERFVGLGLPSARGAVTGSLKNALAIPPAVREQGAALRSRVFADRPVWVAGSVRTGEELAIAEAVLEVGKTQPDAVALVVPRHPEAAPAFAEALRARGLRVQGAEVLEANESLAPGAVVVDRVGVLLMLYAAADVAFVGGTLSPVGGHNVLEPALLERPVVVGPSLDNVRAAAARLKAAGALSIVSDGAELGREVAALLADPEGVRRAGQAGARAAADSAALTATVSAINKLL
ncbi:MAG: 3-deoxy-D-manno-octulosonic acid transferase [Gammaproteobacteria bacterium]